MRQNVSPIRSLSRGLRILNEVLDAPSAVSVAAIARATELHRATVSRMLGVLLEEGFVALDSNQRQYLPGPALASRLRTDQIEPLLRAHSLAALEVLRDASGETVGLHLPVWPDRICIAKAESNSNLRRVYELGERKPLTVGATGLAWLAFVESAELERTLAARPLTALTPQTDTDPVHYRQAAESTRAQGFAVSFSQTVSGMCGIAAPIFGRTGDPIAMITVSGPQARFTEAQMLSLAPLLIQETGRVSAAMGFLPR